MLPASQLLPKGYDFIIIPCILWDIHFTELLQAIRPLFIEQILKTHYINESAFRSYSITKEPLIFKLKVPCPFSYFWILHNILSNVLKNAGGFSPSKWALLVK